MSTYYVSGTWMEDGVITHVAVHEVRDGKVGGVTKLSIEQLLIGMEFHEFYIANWSYANACWSRGAHILAVQEGGKISLRSTGGDTQISGLNHLIRMTNFN